MKKVLILGSTGSIGKQALQVIRLHRDKFKVSGLSVFSDTALLNRQIEEFNPEYVSVEKGGYYNSAVKVLHSAEEMAEYVDADIILLAISGISGLRPAYKAAKRGVRIALANKEALVSAGQIIIDTAIHYGSEIIPVDSEHSAIWQCLMGNNRKDVNRVILTASGGAFRDYSKDRLITVKAREALKHPVWSMGNKVTIDSATLMNKGLEIIEAMRLFNLSTEMIEVLIHRESVVHSMVEYKDHSVIAQLSCPDMRLPIEAALCYPERIDSGVSRLDLAKINALTFSAPDTDRFPCLKIAYHCAQAGGIMPHIMNTANEVAVELYLRDKISFYDVPKLIESALERFCNPSADTIDEILCIDKEVKEYILTEYI